MSLDRTCLRAGNVSGLKVCGWRCLGLEVSCNWKCLKVKGWTCLVASLGSLPELSWSCWDQTNYIGVIISQKCFMGIGISIWRSQNLINQDLFWVCTATWIQTCTTLHIPFVPFSDNSLALRSSTGSSTPHTLISESKFFQLLLIRREADKNETINSTLDIFLVYIHIKVYWVVV